MQTQILFYWSVSLRQQKLVYIIYTIKIRIFLQMAAELKMNIESTQYTIHVSFFSLFRRATNLSCLQAVKAGCSYLASYS